MFNLNPKEDKFYLMFSDAAENVYNAALFLRKSIENLEKIKIQVEEMERLEHIGDKMVHDVIQELNNSFITPMDREDMHEIIKGIDDILDFIDSTMHRFEMFNIKKATDESKVLCDMIVDITKEFLELTNQLKLIGKNNNINDKIININKIENEGDIFFRNTVSNLFRNDKDILNIIKWKEIYQIQEDTLDSCEKVANIIEGAVMKYA